MEVPLSQFEIPHLEMVLEERFGIAPPEMFGTPSPLTVEALAERSAQPVGTVQATLQWVEQEARTLFMGVEAAQALVARHEALCFDARPYEVRVQHPLSWAEAFSAERVRWLARVQREGRKLTAITVALEEARGMSAALFLRGQGIGAHCLRLGSEGAPQFGDQTFDFA